MGRAWVLPVRDFHRKWSYYLFKMLKDVTPNTLINELYKEYPNGLAAHVTNGKVPEQCSGLPRYLGKYVASPQITISRILSYTGWEVTCWYKDHETKAKDVVTLDVMTFIGRKVQHIQPWDFSEYAITGWKRPRP